MYLVFFNQARGWHAPDFLKLILCGLSVCVCVCVCVCMCMCPPPRLLITSDDWLNKLCSCYMAIVVIILNGRGLDIDTRHRHKLTKHCIRR